MKKLLIAILVPYLAVIGVAFYLFFAGGVLFGKYESLEWNGIRTVVPAGISVREYEDKGWRVYWFEKNTLSAKIAFKPAINVTRMHENVRGLRYKTTSGEADIFYISNPRKNIEAVYACNMGDETLYFSVSSASVYTSVTVLEKLVRDCVYNGEPVPYMEFSVPGGVYWTDYLMIFGMTIPLVMILVIFTISGGKPGEKHFEGDPLRYGEAHVQFSRRKKYQRKNTFCYLALTQARLIIFVFKRPVFQVTLDELKRGDNSKLMIEDKKIILEQEDERFILKPADIEPWKQYLGGITY